MYISPYSALIEFEFYNEDQKPNLLLTHESSGHSMTLELQNASQELIAYDETDNHHFELIFRPGTLMNPEQIAVESVGYTLINTPVVNDDGTLSVLIKANEERLWSVWEHIQLSGFKVEAGIGTRSTRMMLRYQHLKHGAGDFSGHLETQLHVVNSIGRINIPLQVGFVGDNHVLNDGQHENELTIRVSNPLRLQQTIPGSEHSKLVLETQSGDIREEWALGTTSQLNGLEIESSPAHEVVRDGTIYTLPFGSLAPGEFIEITISNIITSHPTGHSQLILHYENIPGYRDGQFVLVVEKSPIVITDDNRVGIGTSASKSKLDVIPKKNEAGISVFSPSSGNSHFPWRNNWNYLAGEGVRFSYFQQSEGHTEVARIDFSTGRVGIGTSAPSGLLHVSSGETGHCKLVLEADTANSGTGESNHPHLIFKQDGGLEESAVYMNNNQLILANSVINNAGIVFKTGADSSYTQATERLRITPEGRVGIGSTSPQAKLDVVGDIQLSGSLMTSSIKGRNTGAGLNWEIVSNGEGIDIREPEESNKVWLSILDDKGLHLKGAPNLYADGKVGIGTSNPKQNLHIAHHGSHQSGIRIDGIGMYWEIEVNSADTNRNDQDLLFRVGGSTVCWMEPTGRQRLSSDKRLKKDIEPLGPVLEKVCALTPSRYRWNEDKPDKEKDMGFIAQEVEELFPHLVKEKEGFKNISYSDFGILAIGAIKEQQAEIDDMKKELAEQRKLIEQLIKNQMNN